MPSNLIQPFCCDKQVVSSHIKFQRGSKDAIIPKRSFWGDVKKDRSPSFNLTRINSTPSDRQVKFPKIHINTNNERTNNSNNSNNFINSHKEVESNLSNICECKVDKCYSRDYSQRGRGRVKVFIKNEDKTPIKPEITTKKALLIQIAAIIPKLPKKGGSDQNEKGRKKGR